MLLAPMGCSIQVHKKTDKRSTWAYHSLYGWYIATSPEHYRTHRCQVKSTKSERVKDTVHFNHKRTKKPTIKNAEKVMSAITDCAKDIKIMGGGIGSVEMQDLRQLTEAAIKNNPSIATSPTTMAPRE